LDLEAQQAAVHGFVRQHGGAIFQTFVEIESGKRSDRPELAKALAAAKKAKAILLIANLDRLARNVAFVANLMEAGVDFVACDQSFANRLTVHILSAVAEDEAAGSERTKAALAAARARGMKLGSPHAKQTIAKARAARSAYARRANAGGQAVIADIKASGVASLGAWSGTFERPKDWRRSGLR
jgi:DNA invertase Pin-like site-specific DNA recombinase